MKKNSRGFSLIELIIAIAILIILTGLLAPQFMKFIEKSRKAACMHAMDTVAEEYVIRMVELNKAPDSGSAVNLMGRIITEHGGKEKWKSDEDEKSIVYTFSGLCKSKGNYRCQFVNELQTVRIECSRHGMWELDIVTLHKLLDGMDLSSYGVVYKTRWGIF